MFKLLIDTKSSLDNVHKRLRKAFDDRGIRIGKNISVSQELLAEILGARDYNTLMGEVKSNNEQPSNSELITSFREPYFLPALPNTTYAGRDLILQHLENKNSIQEILFVVAKEGANNGALIVVIIEDNITKVLRTLLTTERKARELECTKVLKRLIKLELLSKTHYINHRFEYGFFDLPPSEMSERIKESERKLLADDPQEFLALFDRSLERIPLSYYSDVWSNL